MAEDGAAASLADPVGDGVAEEGVDVGVAAEDDSGAVGLAEVGASVGLELSVGEELGLGDEELGGDAEVVESRNEHCVVWSLTAEVTMDCRAVSCLVSCVTLS